MKLYRLLALIPVTALVGSGWFANRLEPRVFGLPFLLTWIVGWVIGTSLLMLVIHYLETRPKVS